MGNSYDYRAYAVLYADDEDQSRKYFRKAFERDFRILTAASAEEALSIVQKEGDSIGVLITDQRMPRQSGVELLTQVRREKPNIVRLLTTAYSDLESAIEAVNSGAVFQYISKPWDLRDLKGRLLRAMEFFLVQQERDYLLRERMGSLQRILITDRVRSFAVLACGLAHHIRNSMAALKAFLDLAPTGSQRSERSEASASSSLREDLFPLAIEESQRILDMVQQVVDATVQPNPVFQEGLDLSDVVGRGVAQALRSDTASADSVRMQLEPRLYRLKADPILLVRLFSLLSGRVLGMNSDHHSLVVTADDRIRIWGAPGLRVFIRSDGPPWSGELISSFFTVFAPPPNDPSALGLDLLSAFFIAYHHGGDILVHSDKPLGPGFEVQLPVDPEAVKRPWEGDFAAKIFTHSEAWEKLQSSE